MRYSIGKALPLFGNLDAGKIRDRVCPAGLDGHRCGSRDCAFQAKAAGAAAHSAGRPASPALGLAAVQAANLPLY